MSQYLRVKIILVKDKLNKLSCRINNNSVIAKLIYTVYQNDENISSKIL